MSHRAKHRQAAHARRVGQVFDDGSWVVLEDPSRRDKNPAPRLYHCYACNTIYRQPWQMRLHHWLGCR